MILSDQTIREQIAAGRIVIDPYDDALVQPSSIDVRISHLFRVFRNHTAGVIDVKSDMTGLTELVEMPKDGSEPFMLHPGEFVLGSTLERAGVPDDLVGRGKVSRAWVALGCSFTQLLGLLTPGLMVTSLSSWRMSLHFRSRSTQE